MKNVRKRNMKARLILRRLILLMICLSMILSYLNIIPPVFAEATPGTVEHIADADTTDSYPQLVALRQESRRAGRVWADKSVFTDSITLDMDTDGIEDGTTISNENDFLHVFSALGSSQVVETKEAVPMDVVFVIDVSGSMTSCSTSDRNSMRMKHTMLAVSKAIDELNKISPYNRVGISIYSDTGAVYLPLVNLVDYADPAKRNKGDTNGTNGPQWFIEEADGSYYFRYAMNGRMRKAISKSEWTDVGLPENFGITQTKFRSYYDSGSGMMLGTGTNMQSGIAAGMNILAEESVTQWESPRTGKTYNRIPIVLVMTDGGCNTVCMSYDTADTNDTKAWYDTDYSKRRNTLAEDGDKRYNAASVVPTLLTAAYNMARIDKNYEETPHAFGISVDTPGEPQLTKIKATLNPSPETLAAAEGTLTLATNWDNLDKSTETNAFDLIEQWKKSNGSVFVGPLPNIGGGESKIYVSPLPSGGFKGVTMQDVINHLYFIDDDGFKAVNGNSMGNVFANIIKEFGDSNTVFTPVGGENDAKVKDALTYMDPIGKYMEVKTVKNILLFGKMYEMEEPKAPEYFDKDDNKVTDADAIVNGNYAYTKQYYNIKIPQSGDVIVNPCYGISNATFRLSEIEIYVKKTGNFQDTDVGGGIESDTGNDEALYINIPTMALPMQVANVLLDSGGNAISYETNVGDKEKDAPDVYLEKKAQSTPLRVFYEVGVAKEIKTAHGNVDLTKVNPNYVLENRNEAGDKVYFYSNWYKENIYGGYVTDGTYTYGDAVLTFSPSSDNRYYVFQNYHPVYANPAKDSTGGVVSGSDIAGWTLNGKSLGDPITDKIDPNTWYYILIEYYSAEGTIHFALPRLGSEFGSAIGGESGGVSDNEYLCWYDPKTGDSVPYMNGNVPAPRPTEGNYVIATHPGGLRVGDMAAGIGVKIDENNKSTNLTGTSNTYYMPTVSSSTGGENVVINLYLGNNGRLAVHDTQLLVTKTVGTLSDESNEVLRNMEFEYTVKIEGLNGAYNAIKAIRETITNENGQEETIWRALIKTVELLTNNHGLLMSNDGTIATVGYDPEWGIISEGKDYYIYVGGESAGDNFTHTLFDSDEGHSFTEVLGTDKEITVIAYLVPIGNYGEYWRFNEKNPELIKIDTFPVGQVERGTIGFAVQTGYQSNTTYQTETLHFGYAENAWPEEKTEDWPAGKWKNQPANTADFTLKDGEGLLFIGLKSGVEYTVTEKLTDAQVEEGVSLNYVTHKENGDDNSEKITTYNNKNDKSDDSHKFNNADHTYSVSGETTAVLTEEVNYFNYPPITTKKQVSPDSGFVSVGDNVTYVIYWANDLMDNDSSTADITIKDPLDPGVDFVDAEFVVQNDDGSYEKITYPGWKWTYDPNNHEVIWTIKDAAVGQSGYVRLTVTVNENAPFAFNEDGESLGYPDNKIANTARVTFNGYEFTTDSVETPMDGVHKTEVSVTKPGEAPTDVSTDKGNLKQDAQNGNFVGPEVDKGWEIKYQITFTNYKTEEEGSTITVADRLDPDVKFVSAEYNGVTLTTESAGYTVEDGNIKIKYDTETRTVWWTIDNVEPLKTDDVYLTVQVKSFADDDVKAPEPEPTPQVFKEYTPSGTALEKGRYIMVYDGNAASNTILKDGNLSSLAGSPVTITDGTISESDADAAFMWDVVPTDNGFYLQNVANEQYLKILSGNASFVDNTDDATVWTNSSTAGVLQGKNGASTVYFGYLSKDFRGVLYAFQAKAMTFYKLDKSDSAPEPEPELPEGDKVFENYDTTGKTVLEPGTYIMGYNANALSSTPYNSTALKNESFTMEDGVITKPDPADTIMWKVELSEDGDAFYLKTSEGKYLKGVNAYSGAISFVDDQASATQWVILSGKKNCLGFKGSNANALGGAMMGYFNISSSPFQQMTYYKLIESSVTPGPDVSEKPEAAPLEEPKSGDYKVHNTAGVKVANDAWQITETMENPLRPLTLPVTGGSGFELYVTFGSMLATCMTLWYIEAKRKKRRKC